MLKSPGINLLHKNKKTHGPRFLAIVTPPVDIQGPDDEDPHGHRRATEIARRVYDHYSRPGSRFDFTVWVNAECHSQTTAMLRDILEQVQKQAKAFPKKNKPDGADELKHEIQKHLTGKKYLIFLADHLQDDTSWTQILNDLPTDSSDESSVILTPLVQQAYQYLGWFALSLFFLYRHSRYRVYFYSHLVATRKKFKELLESSSLEDHEHIWKDLHTSIDKILTTCCWDSFSTKMFLHALYTNPHRSVDELERLHRCLNEFSTVSNAISMIRFCYDDLPNQFKVCFVYLSIFPSESEIRRTSLVRRWAAEGLVFGRDGRHATDEAERCFNELVDRGLLLHADHAESPTGKNNFTVL